MYQLIGGKRKKDFCFFFNQQRKEGKVQLFLFTLHFNYLNNVNVFSYILYLSHKFSNLLPVSHLHISWVYMPRDTDIIPALKRSQLVSHSLRCCTRCNDYNGWSDLVLVLLLFEPRSNVSFPVSCTYAVFKWNS